jgi:hypothetical protein
MASTSSGYSRAASSESAFTDQEQSEPALLAIRQPCGGPAGAGEAVRSCRRQASPRSSSSEELDLEGEEANGWYTNGGQGGEGGGGQGEEGGGGSQAELGDGVGERRIEAWDPGAVFF